MKKTIYDLELHDTMRVGAYFVTRVPGGWIYKHEASDVCAFVPYNEEYKFNK